MTEHDDEVAARITNQFRSRDAMVYDLSCGGARLTISIGESRGGDGPTSWRAEAHARQAPERPTVAETGATRGEAVEAVARAWAAKDGAWGFPRLDWEGIAQALRAVRAI
jgi:hypothetical protein